MNSSMPPAGSASSSSAAAARRRPLSARWSSVAADIAQPVVALVLFVALWESAWMLPRVFDVPAYLVPSPSAIWIDT